jgi:hypothetical protein
MNQKVCDISMRVICLEEDAQNVADSLDEWFYGHDVGMRRPRAPIVSEPRDPTDQEIDGLMIENDEAEDCE